MRLTQSVAPHFAGLHQARVGTRKNTFVQRLLIHLLHVFNCLQSRYQISRPSCQLAGTRTVMAPMTDLFAQTMSKGPEGERLAMIPESGERCMVGALVAAG